jgi:hypothetical protein
MSLMAVVEAGHKGLLMQAVAGLLGTEEPVARTAMERLLRALAQRLSVRAADPGEQEVVLDAVARGGYQRALDDPRILFGRDGVRDGEEALAYLYGSLEAARAEARAIGPPAGIEMEVFARLTTLAALLLLAGLARRLEQQADAHLPELGLTGNLKNLGNIILRGLADGTMRTIYRRQPSFRRRMGARRRRPTGTTLTRPGLDELLGDLLEPAK